MAKTSDELFWQLLLCLCVGGEAFNIHVHHIRGCRAVAHQCTSGVLNGQLRRLPLVVIEYEPLIRTTPLYISPVLYEKIQRLIEK
ncbi:hypothetical protein ACTXT7_012252 [Hymenolepis weldensis]